MKTMNNGGPAFPSRGIMGEVAQEGMTLRDYFAAKAMQARLTDYKSVESMADYAQRTGNDLSKVVADQAYEMADAMLRAREK